MGWDRVTAVTCEIGKGCPSGCWTDWREERLSGDKRREKQLPITAHPITKQMKGQASYQLLVVSPEVRKSRVKRKGSGEWERGRGKKKDKIISKLSHALHDNLQTHCTPGPQGRLAKLGGQKLARGLHIPQEKEDHETLSSLVVKMSWSFAINGINLELSENEEVDVTSWWHETGKCRKRSGGCRNDRIWSRGYGNIGDM